MRVLLVILSFFFAQCTAPQDAEVASGQSLLWKIENPGLDKASYLYGTIHIMRARDFSIGRVMARKLDQADKLIMELDMDMSDQLQAATKAMLDDGQSIEDIMDSIDYGRLKSFLLDTLQISKLEFMAYSKLKPIFLSEIFILQVLDEAPKSYELEFASMARDKEMPILGLETVDQQIALIDSIPLDVQIDMLMESLDEYDTYYDFFTEISQLYISQQLDSLYLVLSDEYPEFMDYEQTLVGNRNKKWIPIIKEEISKGSCFIAVGAGHLPGSDGVIQLLINEGYSVTPISTY